MSDSEDSSSLDTSSGKQEEEEEKEQVEEEEEEKEKEEKDEKDKQVENGSLTPVPSPSVPKKYYAVDFDFGEVLGEGAFGAVMKVTLKDTGKDYAIKVMEKKHILKENKVKYVKTERNILSMCRHPNIVSLFCTFSDPENLYYVLELCPNGEILGLLKKLGSFDLRTTQFYCAEIVNAIEYLHERHIIHRDLKPENLLLSQNMHLKLTDFGTTKQLEGADAKNARSNSFVGTAEYVSPELLNVKETCAASDLWALGVIVFQFLTGRMAFHGPTQYMTFQNVIHRRIEYPLEEFPEHAKDLCEALLKMEPDERLGAGPGGYAKLKAHPFFEGIDWDNLATLTPPEAAAYPTSWTWASDEKAKAEAAEAAAADSASDASGNRPSIASSAASSASSSSSDLEQNYNKQATEQWSKHLNKGEHALKAGVIWKRRKMSVKKRMLLLTDRPRLVYIDMRADETMGEIPFTADMKLDVKGKKIFHIKTPGRRWILEDSSKNAQLWVSAIQVQHRRFMASTQ